MTTTISPDGTRLHYSRQGDGPAVVLVGGALDDGAENAPLAEALSAHFTVVNYSRRGRGDSGDTPPYDVAREVEDIAALLDLVDGPACLYGVSSGGALALRAAAAGLPIHRLGVYEVPYPIGDDAVRAWRAYTAELAATREPGAMLELFMRLAGSPDDVIAGARQQPIWAQLEAIAPTLRYDAACLGDGAPDPDLLAAVAQPTLVATGTASDPNAAELDHGYFDDAADLLVELLPRGRRQVFHGQSHVADPAAVAGEIRAFFQD